MKLYFLGAAGTVTGSKIVIEHNETRILIDCGLFQGIKTLRELNWQPISVLPSTIDYVLLTHGHLDHCGWLPKLVKEGFNGKIFCTSPTKQIAKLILLDSAKIQEEEAERANKEHYSKHDPAEPLYTIAKAEKVFPLFKVVDKELEVKLTDDIFFSFFYASHIIGACSIELHVGDKILIFSGDLGQDDDVLLYPAVKPKKADYIVMESTYGNRIHPTEDTKLLLETFIRDTFENDGTVLIPSFAVERAQTLMYLLWQLKKEDRLPNIPLIIDTPMGINVLEVFQNSTAWHKLTPRECDEMCKIFTFISEYKETIDTIYNPKPKVVIAASGMMTGGRILSYMERYVGKPETTIIVVGYQAEGTRGRKMMDGAEEIKIYGKYYPVKAKILELEGLSAHGDQKDLLNWLADLEEKPKKVFLVHGENIAADELRLKISETYLFDVSVPILGQIVEI
jgi:metallo-beta-lactamase family protein